MHGFDALYRNDYEDHEIIEVARKEKRIILTRDLGILKNSKVTHGYFIRSQNPGLQIEEVIKRFQLESRIRPLCRCIDCNGNIVRVEKKAIDHMLEENTRRYFEEFFQCTGCNKIYWEGSHFEKMMDRFKTD
jgi:uncharacterized protein with PIN domain